jgi:hypothetical protein
MKTELLKFDEQAYVHKLNANELGYRNGEPGGAGRHFYVSKSCVGYFPPLSEVVLNDHVLLDLIPPHTDEVVLTKYVYHNSNTATDNPGENRDEYRIYLNSRNDPGRDYFKPDDIVVIVKLYEGENFLYKVLHIKPTSDEYKKVENLLGALGSGRGNTHALIPLSVLTFLPGLRKITIGKKVIPNEIIDEAFKEPVYHSPETSEQEADTTRVLRSKAFRDLILYFYGYQCAITRQTFVIDHKDFINLEAAHLLARASGGGSNPSNGMALERNLHWAFDKGFFTVTDEYKVEVHEKAMRIPYLKEKHGVGLAVPEDSRTRPDKTSLKWHRKNVFGIFLKTEIT